MRNFFRRIARFAPAVGLAVSVAHAESALSYDADRVARAPKLAIFVPGALASVEIFDGARDWERYGYALAYYRFPGLDGRPVDAKELKISDAAGDIAQLANRFPGKKLALVGFSAGAPIILTAAARINNRHDIAIAGLSPAVEHAGGVGTVVRSGLDIIGAAARTGSIRRNDYWLEYWKVLLFGRDGLTDPANLAQIERLTRQEASRMVMPTPDLVRAHTRDLRRWRGPRGLDIQGAKVGFFIGLADPVFSTRQTVHLRDQLGAGTVYGYPGHGHLLFVSHPAVWDDIRAFAEATFDGHDWRPRGR